MVPEFWVCVWLSPLLRPGEGVAVDVLDVSLCEVTGLLELDNKATMSSMTICTLSAPLVVVRVPLDVKVVEDPLLVVVLGLPLDPWLPILPRDPKLNINPGDWLVRVSGPEVGRLWLLPSERGTELVITDVKAIAGTM